MPRIYHGLTVVLAFFGTLIEAYTSRLVVGTFSTPYLYTLKYDDDAGTLEFEAKSEVPAASQWIALNHDGTKLYGTDWNAQIPSFHSYDIRDRSNIKHEATIVGGDTCGAGSKSIFVNPSPRPPYPVYGNYYYGDAHCGTIMTVDADGVLDGVLTDYAYPSASSQVHGTAISADGAYLYSADTGGNAIQVHGIEAATGNLSALVEATPGWPADANPRHLAVHPGGAYLYAVMEGTSEVALYRIIMVDEGDAGGSPLLARERSYALLLAGDDAADFWGDEVALSARGDYLWATTRARDAAARGYISLFALAADGRIEEQLWLGRTTSSGGFANSVAPHPVDNRLAALTDNSTGFVQVWNTSEFLLAELVIDDGGGCCANAVWLPN
ncbi:Lactonase, 7-bladed beta-propeller-domain-containing protein [Xylariomycetidae sp. FL0641]|nr:Lactonase, 7-bladed beta-propeller-domain-containing protein [Xylariomycetidae sp. FL0641]